MLRDPSRLSFQLDTSRRLIIASYCVIIFAAVPVWWQLTSIERLSLPTAQVYSQANNELRFPIRIKLENVPDESLPLSLQRLMHDRIQRSPYAWKGIDVSVRGLHDADVPGHEFYTVAANDDVPLARQRHLTYPIRNETLSILADTLSMLLVPPTDAHRVAQYAPRYRLAFILLNEDAAAGRAISGWDVSAAISRHLSPLLDDLSVLHNFTIESQVQFYAPLAFPPISLPDGYGLSLEDLTVFVNSAEWSLSSSVSNDPVLHFVVFIPSASRRPLRILDTYGHPSSSDAFLLPQWGGIVIYNPAPGLPENSPLPPSALDSVFSTFANQLLALLGVPTLPPDIQTDDSALTGWQLDALLRRRAMQNAAGAQDTLKSITKLVDQIDNMPVGQDVKGDVQDSLAALEQMYASASVSLNETVHQSADALTLASRAFFYPGMLALLYFPAEHKYVVYIALLLGGILPVMATTVREIRAWRRQRGEA